MRGPWMTMAQEMGIPEGAAVAQWRQRVAPWVAWPEQARTYAHAVHSDRSRQAGLQQQPREDWGPYGGAEPLGRRYGIDVNPDPWLTPEMYQQRLNNAYGAGNVPAQGVQSRQDYLTSGIWQRERGNSGQSASHAGRFVVPTQHNGIPNVVPTGARVYNPQTTASPYPHQPTAYEQQSYGKRMR